MVNRIIAGVISVLLLLEFSVAAAADSTDKAEQAVFSGDGFSVVSENQELSLYFNELTTEFKVLNKKTGYLWSSSLCGTDSSGEENNPADYVSKSILIVNYIDTKKVNEDYVSSYSDSVEADNYTVKPVKNGVRIDFRFSFLELTVPVTLTLSEDSFRAELITREIEYDSNVLTVQSISLLPYFGAAGADKTGYAFLPDGCGGLAYFDRNRSENTYYEKPVYGADISSDPNEHSDITLPVFGMCHGNDSYLAVITSGATDAYINCTGNTDAAPYTRVFAKFDTATETKFQLVEQNNMTVYEKGGIKAKSLSVSYYFIDGAESNYSGMAKLFKKITFGEKNNVANPIKPALYVDLYAAVSKIRSVWGVKLKYNCVLTSMEDADQIFSELHKRGVDTIVARYNNFDKCDINDRILKSYSWNNALGKKPAKTIENWRKDGIGFYLGYGNTQTYLKSANPFHTLTTTARDPADSPVMYRQKLVSDTSGQDNALKESYVLNYKNLKKNLTSLIASLEKNRVSSTAFSQLGSLLYSDFRYDVKKRTDFSQLISKTLAGYIEKGNTLLLEAPNYYAAVYSDDIINLPVTFSGQDMIDEDVPFLQLFYNGVVRYSCKPVNLCADSSKMFLKAVETGSMPCYSWIGRDSSLLTNTELEYMYSADYRGWIDTAAEQYRAVLNIAELSNYSTIKNHKRLGSGFNACVYENGTAIVVNYNTEVMYLSDGTAVEPGTYLVVKEGQL